MGNNNSTNNNKMDSGQQFDISKYFIRSTNQQKTMLETRAKADQLYDQINQNNGKIIVERKIEIFTDPTNGTPMPYFSDQRNATANGYDPLISTENMTYIEIEDPKGMKTYAVHRTKPDHECKANCYCIEKILEASNDEEFSIFSPTTSEKQKVSKSNIDNINEFLLSATSPEPVEPSMILSATSPGPVQLVNQTGACSFCFRSSKDHMTGGICSALRKEKNNEQMLGGEVAEDKTSPEDLTDSEEETDEAFSATSDMSDTMTSPDDDIEPKDRKDKNKVVVKKENIDDEEVEEDDDDEDINEDEDEILEGIDDEDITEDGFILEQSDISSSDLYRMQSRIFRSNTDTNRSQDDNDETTEKVRRAMNNASRRGIFDSEERDILNIKSSSDDYMRRPARKNNKYY